MNTTGKTETTSNNVINRTSSGTIVMTSLLNTHPTVKTEQVLPCNHYYNVIISNGHGAWQGSIVTYLSLEDWCTLNGYRLFQVGCHIFCDPNGAVKTRLWEIENVSDVAS